MLLRKPYFSVLILSIVTVILPGCINITRDNPHQKEKETSVQVALKPIINQFAINPNNISSGQSTTIIWSVTNAESVIIEPGIGNVALSGSATISPPATMRYIIIAKNAEGTSTATTAISVRIELVSPPSSTSPSPTPPTTPTSPVDIPPTVVSEAPPEISYFTGSPTSINHGDSSTLSWSVANASSVHISSGIGPVATTGFRSVSPAATTTYTLTATNSYGPNTRTVTVTVSNFEVILPSAPYFTLKADLDPIYTYRHSLMNYTVAIKNIGTGASGPFKIKVMTSSDTIFLSSPSIGAGETGFISFTLSPDSNCGWPITNFNVTVVVDPSNAIEETNDGNNTHVIECNCP